MVFASGKGSPGVTTTMVALASVWPRPVVVVECDPAGGDLAYRMRTDTGVVVARDPGLVSLVAACRTAGGPVSVNGHCQVTAGGIALVRGVASPAQAVGVRPYWPAVATSLAAQPQLVFADAGRLEAGGVVWPLVGAADVVVLVARVSVAGLAHLRETTELLSAMSPGRGRRVAVVVVAAPGDAGREVRYAREVTAHTGAVACGWIGVDPPGVRAVYEGRRRSRSVLVRTSRVVAAHLAALLPPPHPAEATPGVGAVDGSAVPGVVPVAAATMPARAGTPMVGVTDPGDGWGPHGNGVVR